MADKIKVRMLGKFAINWNGAELSDADNRMRIVWLLLAYIIYRRAVVTPDEIMALLWEGEEESDNPSGALKTMLYRARTLLNKLADNAGQTLIIRRDGGYIWNPEIETELDVAELDELYSAAAAAWDDDARLELQLKMLEVYGGDFLPKLSSETWAMPISAYYHRVFLETVSDVLPKLEEREQWQDSLKLSTAALKIEPYSEELYCHLMRAQLAQGDRQGAMSSYENMSELLFSQFGVMPSDEARNLYRAASRSDGAVGANISDAKELLKEESAPTGALFCEYDFFKILYQAQARAIIRSGDSIHIALLTLSGKRGQELSRRSLDIAAENLKQVIISNLRQGDIVTQCSASQLLVMLPQANYENSVMVCDRLTRAFYRQYPHSPADIHVSVQPLEPA